MKKIFLSDLKKLVKMLSKQEDNLYYKKFHTSPLKSKDLNSITEESFLNLPITTIKELALTPYSKRLTKEGIGFNKLVLSSEADKYYLVHRNLEEIKDQQLSIVGIRPMVLMENVYESIELCLYFYERGKLPLIGEVLNSTIVYETAKQYQVDSLYLDQSCFKSFSEQLFALDLPLKSVTIIDSKKPMKFENAIKGINYNQVFSLPETGPILYICPESLTKKTQTFHPTDDIYIESGKKAVITSSRLAACPVIRLEINVSMAEVETYCSCKEKSFQL